MKRIWAPWRKGYVEEGAPDGCIFCPKAGREDDAERHIIARGKSCFSMLNRFPYNSGHLMVAPFRHVADLSGLDEEEFSELMAMARGMVGLLRRKLKPEGFNVGLNLGRVAGAGFADHLHVHVVPRWGGDTNFMPVLGETKVIPHSLEEMYKRLREAD